MASAHPPRLLVLLVPVPLVLLVLVLVPLVLLLCHPWTCFANLLLLR
jgi:hypothetical protein